MIDQKKEELTPVDVSSKKDFRIIAIGASAGGLEALKEFFNNVPPDCEHSFVIVQHLSPDYKSLMAELLAKNTILPIYEIKNRMQVNSGCIYLIPPKKNMTIVNNRLILEDKPITSDLNLPIDIFFRSLAQDVKEQAICVILSGTGSDGTSGARAVKEVGGLVMVQEPTQAKFDGMPLSAIGTGLVDYVMPVEQLPAEVIHFIDHPTSKLDAVKQIENDEDTVDRILHHIYVITKLDFTHYKRPTLVRRIARRISVNRLNTLKDYLKYIYDFPKEVYVLSNEFLIGVTNFFRDTAVWEKLEAKYIPELVKSKESNQLIKVWCAGTSTGEEAYSMAILLFEEIERQGKKLDVKIFATDLDSKHLEIASKGAYSESIMADVSPDRLRKHFVRVGDHYQIVDNLRRMVIFSQHNLLRDPPFNKTDITVCRNLLIYIQPKAQRKIIGTLHYSLNLNGILLLGSSETLGDYTNVMKELDRPGKLYRNIKPARALGMEPLNYPDIQKLSPVISVSASGRGENKMAEIMNEAVAEELGLAAVYIDENYNILHAVGEFSKFVKLPDRGFSVNLLKMLPEDATVSIGSAVRKVVRKKERVLYKAMKMSIDGTKIILDLLVSPFEINRNTNTTGCLLLFMPKDIPEGTAEVIHETSGAGGARINELEDELRETRHNLQLVVQEVETSNEELQATNEELLAANEELQSTNEELQSVNEELHTVNAELYQKMEDLSSLNADMDNLLVSTSIGSIFLDKELRIRKFTPEIQENFNLRLTDIDRPIHHFASNFDMTSDVLDNINQVLNSGELQQTEVQTNNGDWYLKRTTPYYNTLKNIDGVVISFVNINTLKESEAKIKKSELEFKALFNNAPDMFASFNINGGLINCNTRFYKKLGYNSKEEVIDLNLSDLYRQEEASLAQERYLKYRETGKLENMPRKLKRKDNSSIDVSVNAEMILDDDGNELYSICAMRDVSALKIAEKKYLDQNLAFEEVLESTMAGYWDWNIQEGTEYLSPTFKKMFGYEVDEMENTPEAWQKIVHPDDLEAVFEVYDSHVKSKGEIHYDNQVRYFHKNGHIVWVLCRGKIIEWDADGNPVRMIGSHVNITPIKKIEEELYESNRELEQFAYVASHDLQEPLRTITDFVNLFSEQYKGNIDDDADQYLKFITEAATRMSNLVKSVLNFSRIGQEKTKTEVDCNVIAENVIDDLAKIIKDTGTIIKFQNLPKLICNKFDLYSLFYNLIANSIKFRKKDIVTKISLNATLKGNLWHFKLVDNGIGIAEKNKNKIFDIFQRLHNSDDYPGTGIGLAQCKKIVQLHGGEINVESKLGKGSTFIFTLKRNYDKA